MEEFYQADFKFHLYCSFQNREEAIGLDLIEALVKVNKALGLYNFEVVVRLSQPDEGQPKLPRWTHDYIEKEISWMDGPVKKVWVVGPPVMNQLFDQTLGSLSTKLNID